MGPAGSRKTPATSGMQMSKVVQRSGAPRGPLQLQQFLACPSGVANRVAFNCFRIPVD